MECEDYSSIGVNLGDLNLELIQFRKRFGIRNTKFHGISGIALETKNSIEACQTYLTEKGMCCRVGELAEGHTTLTIDENDIYPTIFVVKYNFDTTGWKHRLQSEFQDA